MAQNPTAAKKALFAAAVRGAAVRLMPRTERRNVELLLKRAYEKPARSDGFRVLVDRLWPRGVSKAALRLDMWAKAVSLSTTLRKWFAHDPDRWQEFGKRYKVELKESEAREALGRLGSRKATTRSGDQS